MTTQRLTSFTDGVIAIIITIMVLELPVPHAPGMAALQPLSVLFAAYALYLTTRTLPEAVKKWFKRTGAPA